MQLSVISRIPILGVWSYRSAGIYNQHLVNLADIISSTIVLLSLSYFIYMYFSFEPEDLTKKKKKKVPNWARGFDWDQKLGKKMRILCYFFKISY